MPLGVGFALWRRAPAWRIFVEAVVLGAIVATGLELAQLVTLYRYTSFADMWRNTVSCAFGPRLVKPIAWTDPWSGVTWPRSVAAPCALMAPSGMPCDW